MKDPFRCCQNYIVCVSNAVTAMKCHVSFDLNSSMIARRCSFSEWEKNCFDCLKKWGEQFRWVIDTEPNSSQWDMEILPLEGKHAHTGFTQTLTHSSEWIHTQKHKDESRSIAISPMVCGSFVQNDWWDQLRAKRNLQLFGCGCVCACLCSCNFVCLFQCASATPLYPTPVAHVHSH